MKTALTWCDLKVGDVTKEIYCCLFFTLLYRYSLACQLITVFNLHCNLKSRISIGASLPSCFDK